jgi:tight adherence protein C
MSVAFLFSLTVFIVLFLLCVGIYRVVRESKAKRGFIEKIAAIAEGWPSPDQETAQVKNRFFNFLSSLGKRASPEKQSDYQQTRIYFLRAGIRHANVLSIFWGTKILLAVCLPLAFFVSWVTIFKILGFTRALAAVCIFLAVVGLYLPNFWLRLKIARRKNKIFEGIADAMDLLVVCVEAGMGLDSALYRVGEEITLTHKPLGDELKFYNLEMRAGMSRRDALKNLALRVDLEEVRSVASLLIQAEKFGTSVAHSLRVYSDSFRTKRFQRAEEIAAKLPVKLVIPLMLFIMPALFVVLVGPAAISLFHAFGNR